MEQIHKIFKLCGSPSENYCKRSKVPETAMFKPQQQYRRCVTETFKDLPPPAVLLIDSLLSLEPEGRGTAASALQSEVISFFFLHLAFRACVSYMSALMPSTRLCFWNICLSFSEPNHSLATLRAYRNSHQAKSTMSDLGKKKPGGTWYCRPYCDASVDLGFIVMLTFALLCFIKAKKRGGTWRARS